MAGGKRKHEMETDDEEEHNTEGGDSEGQIQRLWPRNFYKCTFTIRRRQHLTIPGYKPGDSTTSFGSVLLPVSILDFWLQKTSNWAQPFKKISSTFNYCAYHHASIKLSHFIPLQRALTPATSDVTTFNISPYCYIVEDKQGLYQTLTIPSITKTNFKDQSIRIKSSEYWGAVTDTEEGLLALSDVQTIKANEVYHKHYKFHNHPRYYWNVPTESSTDFTYIPADLEYWLGVGNTGSIPAVRRKIRQTGLDTESGDFTHTYNKMGAIWLFLPFIEPISTSEDATRLLGHFMMETSITLTCFSGPDGYDIINNNHVHIGNCMSHRQVPFLGTKSMEFGTYQK